MTTQSPPTDIPPSPTPGWTSEKQRTFLEALARCGSVKSAAAYTGMSREGAYRLRRRDEGRAFARAWDAALIHARDLYAETLLDTGLNGWTETVWYHGEEVGERTRFSPGLLLAALARLDAKADGMDLAGDPAREAAGDFEALVAAIGEGKDCTAMLDQQDQAAQARRAPAAAAGFAGLSGAEIINRIEMFDERERITKTAPEDIDTSDLDPYEADDWDDLQWARAERSGMMAEPGFWEKADPEGEDTDGERYESEQDPGEGLDGSEAGPHKPQPDAKPFH